MKYLDKYLNWLTAINFRKDTKGNHLYFPWGALGPGYELTSATEMRKLRTAFMKVLLGTFAALLIGNKIWGLLGIVLAGLGSVARFSWWSHVVTRDLKLSRANSAPKGCPCLSGASQRRLVLLVAGVVSVMGLIAGVMGLAAGGKFVSSFLIIVFFGGCVFAIVMLLVEKGRKK